MEYINTQIPGVVILKPHIIGDSRGYFTETFRQSEFDAHVRPIRFVQENESCSVRGVIRGLHFQRMPYSQSKLVRCVRGRVLDVAVDLRSASPTFGKHVAVELSDDNHLMLFIPRGFAHGFSVLSESATFQYKCDAYYPPESEGGIDAFDSSLDIDWRIEKSEALVSAKDSCRPRLSACKDSISFNGNLYDFL